MGLVIEPNEKKILLLKRNKNPYKNCYNGLGGKINEGESELMCMVRELGEEAGISDVLKIAPLVNITFPTNGIQLYVFYILYDWNNIMYADCKEGKLEWKNFDFVLDIKNDELAGDGNLTYFMKLILNLEKDLLN